MVLVSGWFSTTLLSSNPSYCASAQRGQTNLNVYWACGPGFDNTLELSCIKTWGKRELCVFKIHK